MPIFIKQSLSRKINIFTLFMLALFSSIVFGFLYFEVKESLWQKNDYSVKIAENVFQTNMNFEKSSLLQTLTVIKHDKRLLEAFAHRDRAKLLATASPFFKEIKQKHKITHLYFITKEQICFLRVHSPNQNGDKINRVTLQNAVQTQNEFVGLEMGKNFFSLRAVAPVFLEGELIGYVEIGREIDHFFDLFKKQTGYDITLLLDDSFVQDAVKKGTHLMPQGDRIKNFVILNTTDGHTISRLIDSSKIDFAKTKAIGGVELDDKSYFYYQKQMLDANKNYVGRIVVYFDKSSEDAMIKRQYGLLVLFTIFVMALMGAGIRYAVNKEILTPLEKIREGLFGFFDFLRGESKKVKYIQSTNDDEIGQIASALNENMEETVAILDENRKNEAYLLHRSRVGALGEMIGNIAHHWRQPLNIISITAQDLVFAKDEGTLTDEYLKNEVALIVKTASELSSTLDKVRIFYKNSEEKESFSLNKVVLECVEFFRGSLEGDILRVDFIGSEEIYFSGYKGSIRQAILTVLQNSKDAIELREIKNGRISVEISKKETEFVIRISDNGGGVSKEYLESIFDPYFTTKHKSKDVGLGLYLAKMNIEKSMSGTMRAFNSSDGLVVEITLG